MAKNIICEPTGYVLVGLVAISLWGGGEGTMPMYDVKFDHEPTANEIREAINDGGMGCESYLGAVVRLDTVYTHGARTYGNADYINLSRCSDEHVKEVLAIGHEGAQVNLWDAENIQS